MAVGFRVASAWVDIRAEDKGLKSQVKRIVREAAAGQEVKISVKFETKRLRNELDNALKRASRGQKTAIPVRIDSKGLRKELDKAVKAAARGQKTSIPVTIDSKGLRREIKTAFNEATRGQKFKLPLTVDSKGLRREINRALTEATAGKKPTVKIGIDSRGLRGEVNRAIRGAMAGQRVNVPLHMDSHNLARDAGNMGRIMKIVLASITAVAPAMGLLESTVKAMGPSLAVLVTSFTTLATMGATIMVGMNGVGQAIEMSGKDAKGFAEAMEYLTPSAQRFVKAVVSTKGAFKGLRDATQETLLHGMDVEFKKFAKDTIPSFRIGLGAMAIDLRGMAKGVMDVTRDLARTGELKAMFGGMALAMQPMLKMPGQLTNALVKMSIAATPLFIRMTTAAGTWSDSMTEKLNRAFDNGTLQAAITRSGNSIVNFFRKIGNNPEWKKFIQSMHESAPQMAHILSNLAEASLRLVNAFAPVSGALLHIANATASLVQALPSGFLSTLIGIYLGFKLFGKVRKVLVGVTEGIIGLVRATRGLVAGTAIMTRFSTAAAASSRGARAVGLLANVVSRLTVAGLAVGAAFVVLRAAGAVINTIFPRATVDMDKMNKSMLKLAQTGKLTGTALKTYGKNFGGLKDAMKTVDDPSTWQSIVNGFNKFGNMIGVHGDRTERATTKTKAFAESFKKLAKQGYGPEIIKMLRDSGMSMEDIKKSFPGGTKATEAFAKAQKEAHRTMGMFGSKSDEVAAKLNAQERAAENLKNSYHKLDNQLLGMSDTSIGWEQSLDDATQALKDNGKTLDIHTQKGRDNQTALNGIVTASQAHVEAMANSGATEAELVKQTKNDKKAWIDQATAFGMSTTKAKELANQYFNLSNIPDAKLKVDLQDEASTQLTKVSNAFKAAPDKKSITVEALGAPAVKMLEDLGFKVTHLKNGKFKVTADSAGAMGQLDDLNNKKVLNKLFAVYMNGKKETVNGLNEVYTAFKKTPGKKTVTVGALTKKAKTDLENLGFKVKTMPNGKTKITASTFAASKQIKDLKARVKDLEGSYTVTFTMKDLVSGPAKSMAAAIRRQAANASKKKAAGGIIRRATGGLAFPNGHILGAGGETSDSIPALLSNNEYVMKAKSVRKFGTHFMDKVNAGHMPGFAVGGAVNGARVSSASGGLGGSTGAAGGAATATTGTFSVTDKTGKPVQSAIANFKLLEAGVAKTYGVLGVQTNKFGQDLSAKFLTTGQQSQRTWATWGTGMQSRSTAAFKGIKAATNTFSRDTVAKTTQAKTGTQSVWNSWKSGMQSRTDSTYNHIKSATSSFSKQSVSKIGAARDGMGHAWGGLSPKFKPPVSYLVHSVINKGVVGSMNAIMTKLGGGKKVGGISVSGFATGGHVRGAGSGTSDSIPARLSNGEFVMQASAVKKFGTGFMTNVNNGQIPKNGPSPTGFSMGGGVNINMSKAMPGFASGGVVGVPSADTLNKIMGEGSNADVKKMTDFIMNSFVLPLIDSGSGGSAMKDVQRAGMNHIRSNIESFVKDNFGGAGSAAAGLRWAKTQNGKPYQWGGNGNPSWDCSGFMSAIESVIRGEKPHRRWATGAFPPGTPGWKQGAKAPFQIGITNAGVGHTAGTIGKTNVESSGGGVKVGGSARGASNGMFTSRWGYRGPSGKHAAGGYISGPGGPTSDSIPSMLSNGEFVMKAASVKRFGTGFMSAINSGQMPGFATGGSVGTTYTIKSGDTLSGIAAKFHTTTKALMALNKTITNANKIYAGRTIVISGGSTSGGTTTGGGTTTTPPFSLGTFSKVGKTGIESAEGTSALGAFATLSQESISAGKTDSEVVNAFQAHESTAALLEDLFDTESKIRAAFKGASQDKMIAAYEKSNKAAIALQQKLDPIVTALADAQTKLDDITGQFDQMKTSISDNIKEFGAITKIGTYGTSPQTLLTQLQSDVSKASEFGTMLQQLKASGLNSDMIGQIATAGITGGGTATAASLLRATPEQIAQINTLQAQLTTAADKTGQAAADGMYGAGVQAAQGLVAGLKAQQSAIADQMTIIAKAMEKAIKQALGIKSPSRVMMAVGHHTADGLINAVNSRQPEANAAIRGLVDGPAGSSTAGTSVSRPVSAGTIASGSTNNYFDICVKVEGTMDLTRPGERKKIAKALADDIQEAVRANQKKRK